MFLLKLFKKYLLKRKIIKECSFLISLFYKKKLYFSSAMLDHYPQFRFLQGAFYSLPIYHQDKRYGEYQLCIELMQSSNSLNHYRHKKLLSSLYIKNSFFQIRINQNSILISEEKTSHIFFSYSSHSSYDVKKFYAISGSLSVFSDSSLEESEKALQKFKELILYFSSHYQALITENHQAFKKIKNKEPFIVSENSSKNDKKINEDYYEILDKW